MFRGCFDKSRRHVFKIDDGEKRGKPLDLPWSLYGPGTVPLFIAKTLVDRIAGYTASIECVAEPLMPILPAAQPIMDGGNDGFSNIVALSLAGLQPRRWLILTASTWWVVVSVSLRTTPDFRWSAAATITMASGSLHGPAARPEPWDFRYGSAPCLAGTKLRPCHVPHPPGPP